ncbi:MAG: DsrE family protein [Burkholderiales bacterium]
MRSIFRSSVVTSSMAALLLAATAGVGHAQTAPTAKVAVPGFGAIHTAPAAAEHPTKSLRYKVLFSITQGNDDTAKPSASLNKVARFMNLLAADGVRPKSGDVVAVVHGGATPIVMSDAAFKARSAGSENPSLELIDQLKKAGVSVRVCSQALAAASIEPDAVDKRVQIDVAALTTMANLQLKGYALIPD